MDTKSLIDKILKAVKLSDVLDISKVGEEYKNVMKFIHPDICKLPKAHDACVKLNALKEEFEVGKDYVDESGKFKSNGFTAVYTGDITLLKKSLENYKKLKAVKSDKAEYYHKWLPDDMTLVDNKLTVKFRKRAIPISGLELPQKHVNWILSRMLEICVWFDRIGYVHCGINPESIFICPEDHSIQIASFYMLTKEGMKPSGLSGPHYSWYPPKLFASKKATSDVDIELSMKTAIYLLGDKSGVGIKLKKSKDVNQEFLNFATAYHTEPGETFIEYRDLLKKNFKVEFHVLDL